MNNKQILLILITAFVPWVGCSSDGHKHSGKNTKILELDRGLPDAAVLMVPLDESGNEMKDQAQLRGLQSWQPNSETDLAEAFAEGSELEPTESEEESSTPSWHFTKTEGPELSSQQQYDGYNNSQQYANQNSNYAETCQPQPSCRYEVQHRQGTVENQYPTRNTDIVYHDRVNVYPVNNVNVYRNREVVVHPEQTNYTYHPIQERVTYAQPCAVSYCAQAPYAQYWPTWQYQGYQQYYSWSYRQEGYFGYNNAQPCRYYIYHHPRWY